MEENCDGSSAQVQSSQLHALVDTDIRSPSGHTVISGNSRFWVTNQQEGPPKGVQRVPFQRLLLDTSRPDTPGPRRWGVSRLHGSFRSATTQDLRFLRFVRPNPLSGGRDDGGLQSATPCGQHATGAFSVQ
jgi:hypothetical protein